MTILARAALGLAITLLATASAPVHQTRRPYSGTPIDVTTFHYDTLRTGWNQSETDLTPATVKSAGFGLLTTLPVDGAVLAQPLLLSNFIMPDGTTHDVLIVATMHNSVYAFDAQTYAILWQVSLGTAQSASDIGCTDLPEYGIASTPVILRSGAGAATIYLESATEPSALTFVHQVHALNLGTGQDAVPPVTIAASARLSTKFTLSFNPKYQWFRAGLAYSNGALYLGATSHCDHDRRAISGWLFDYNTQLQQLAAFHSADAADGTLLGSVWMSGFAPAIDSAGNILFATGNGQVLDDNVTSAGQSVLSLSPGLGTVNSSFTPSGWAALNSADEDLGSGGVMLLPAQTGQTAPPLAVAMGKSGSLYLLNQGALGGLHANDSGALQALQAPGHGVWGGPAYYNGPAGAFVYYQTRGSKLLGYAVSAGATPSLTLAVQGVGTGGYGGSMPVVSSNGAAANTGIVWLIARSTPLQLEAYDANTLGHPIFVAPAGSWTSTGNVNAFVSPFVANGHVYAPSDKAVSIFGLKP